MHSILTTSLSSLNVVQIIIKRGFSLVNSYDCHTTILELVDTLTQCLKSVNHYGGHYFF